MTIFELLMWLGLIALIGVGAGLWCGRKRHEPRGETEIANREELQGLKDAARGGFFRIRRYNYEDPGDKGMHYFELCAGGIRNEPVAISERYKSKSGAYRGIESVRRWALTEEVIEELDTDTSRDGAQVPCL